MATNNLITQRGRSKGTPKTGGRKRGSPDILVSWNAQEQYLRDRHRGRADEPDLRPRPQVQ